MPNVCVIIVQQVKHGEVSMLQGSDNVSLCQCALRALSLISLPQSLNSIVHSVLSDNQTPSLARAQSALEMWLWGPTHLPQTSDAQVRHYNIFMISNNCFK